MTKRKNTFRTSSETPVAKKPTPLHTPFDYAAFCRLSINEHKRYGHNSKHVGHVLFVTGPDGQKNAWQYALPQGDEPGTPKVCTLTRFEELQWGDMKYRRAQGPRGETFYIKRSGRLQIRNEMGEFFDAELGFASEEDEGEIPGDPNHWGSAEKIERFNAGPRPITRKKGGELVTLDPAVIAERDSNHDRLKTQNEVMGLAVKNTEEGYSACEAVKEFHLTHQDELSTEMATVLARTYNAKLRSRQEKYRGEWPHLVGWGLGGPQDAANLVAATNALNTQMMPVERLVKEMLLNGDADEVTLQNSADMLPDSEVADLVHCDIKITTGANQVRIMQELDPFEVHPVLPKGSDASQLVAVLGHNVLKGKEPVVRESVTMLEIPAAAQNLSRREIPHFFFPRQYQVVPEMLPARTSDHQQFRIAIIDTETTGTNRDEDEIIELAILLVSFTREEGILAIEDFYTGLQQPKMPIIPEVTQINGISNEMVTGKAIDWSKVSDLLQKTNYVACHNSGFDRRFLERDTPPEIRAIFSKLPFGCTMLDIDWKAKGCQRLSLDYLNRKMGFVFSGHRALNDCYATLNLLRQGTGIAAGAFNEFFTNVDRTDRLILVTKAYGMGDSILKPRGFHWSQGGEGKLPQGYFAYISESKIETMRVELLAEMAAWKGDSECKRKANPQISVEKSFITATDRYSIREESLGLLPQEYFRRFRDHLATELLPRDDDESSNIKMSTK